MGKFFFRFDERLGISLPALDRDWESYEPGVRESVVACWEQIRGAIPERIRELEQQINEKQAQMDTEPDFAACCRINSDIAELASRINDLHIWFRIRQDVHPVRMHQ